MRSLYLDLNDSGLSWNRPAQVSPEEARKLLNHAVNDYAVQRDKMDQLRELGDPELADALEAWQQRLHYAMASELSASPPADCMIRNVIMRRELQ